MTEQQNTLILLFRSGERLLGLPVETIREVVPAFEVMQAPGLMQAAVGLISLRGDILPLVDCAQLLDGARTVLRPHHKFIIVEGGDRTFAILSEHIDDFIEASAQSDIRPDASREQGGWWSGIVIHQGTMVMILEVGAMLQAAPPVPVTAMPAAAQRSERIV